MKKNLNIIMLLVFCFLLSSCGFGASDSLTVPKLDDRVLYEENNLSLSIKDGIKKSQSDLYSFNLTFENNTPESWQVEIVNLSVQGTYYDGACKGKVESSGNPSTAEFTIDGLSLIEYGLKDLNNVKFKFKFTNLNDESKNFISNYIYLIQDENMENQANFDINGVELINKDGVKLIGLGLIDSASGKAYKYYLENNTNKDLVIRISETDKTLINQDEQSFSLLAKIPAQSKSYDITFLNDEGLKKYIDSKINSMKCKFIVNEENLPNEILFETSELELINNISKEKAKEE